MSQNEPNEPTILHETPTALIVNKESGRLVHNSSYAGPKERSLRMNLGRVVGMRVFPVHRIDRPTSGIVVFARETEYVEQWQHALSAPSTRKEYVGVATGVVETRRRMIDHHVKVRANEKKNARTEILGGEVSTDESCTLLLYRLHSGRKHQIRQHMKHLRQPLLEDTTYGKGRFNRPFRDAYGLDRLALHAWHLRITPPDAETEGAVSIRAPLPQSLTRVFDQLFEGGLAKAVERVADRADAAAT
jgi:tRNA pseudouridine65 synthase